MILCYSTSARSILAKYWSGPFLDRAPGKVHELAKKKRKKSEPIFSNTGQTSLCNKVLMIIDLFLLINWFVSIHSFVHIYLHFSYYLLSEQLTEIGLQTWRWKDFHRKELKKQYVKINFNSPEFGLPREPISILLFIVRQISHIIKLLTRYTYR